jgi:hypothetical protein
MIPEDQMGRVSPGDGRFASGTVVRAPTTDRKGNPKTPEPLLGVALPSLRYDERRMAKYLITGIAGFIGSALARAVVAQGDQVRGLDNFSTGKRENISEILPQIDFREGDLLDSGLVQAACQGMDYILHQAAIASVPRSVKEPLASHRANLDGTVNLLIAARDAKVKRVVYAASSSAYGDTPTLPKQEGMTPNPISPYAVSKLASEYYMMNSPRFSETVLRAATSRISRMQCMPICSRARRSHPKLLDARSTLA